MEHIAYPSAVKSSIFLIKEKWAERTCSRKNHKVPTKLHNEQPLAGLPSARTCSGRRRTVRQDKRLSR